MALEQGELALVDEVLSTARSVRRKLDFDRTIDPQTLFEAIDVAVQAPTGLGGENWRFVVVQEDTRKQKLAELYREVLLEVLRARDLPIKPTHQALIDKLPTIPAMIFVCVDGVPPIGDESGQIGFYGSILPAAWSLMLALRARSIGSTWTSLLSSRQTEVAEILGMPEDTRHTVMLPVGYTKGATLRRADRRPATEVTYWDIWGELRG